MDLQICYKGYVLKVEILRMTGYKDKFRLKGLCKEVGFEFVSEMDESALDILKQNFKEHIEYSLNQEESFTNRLEELKELVETNPKCVLRVLDGLTTKERDGTTLLEIVVSIYAKEQYTEDKKSLYAIKNLLSKVVGE